ncbi:MAG TPA: pyroglutamyl-peptidase I [Ramlibacter sp.]|nr:pyroglutamyl-peptidase I [Ramlibacter sp.]
MLDEMPVSGRQPGTVLVTGFDPFGGSAVNPSWDAVHALHGRVISGHRVVGGEIPTVFGLSLHRLATLMEEHRPTLVICTGQAGGRGHVSLERVAINVNDARIADNAGSKPIDVAIVPDGPAAYFTSLPIKAMLQALLDAGVRAEVSQTAGTFVCNQTFYGLMHLLSQPQWSGTRGGLIHVPWLPEQGTPFMRLEELVRGLEIAIATALSTRHDIRKEAGALS